MVREFDRLGFRFDDLGKTNFVVTGIPGDALNNNARELLEKILDNYKKNMLELNQDQRVTLAMAMASNLAQGASKTLAQEEMEALVSQLFSSSMPDMAPSGKKIINILGTDDIEKLF